MSMVFFQYDAKGGIAARKAAAAIAPLSHRVGYRLARHLRQRNIAFDCNDNTRGQIIFDLKGLRSVRVNDDGAIVHHVWDAQYDQAMRARDHARWLTHAGKLRTIAFSLADNRLLIKPARDVVIGALDMAAYFRRSLER